MADAASLLSTLVLGGHGERAAVLHGAVMLRQADGTTHSGRRDVLASFSRASPGASYEIVERVSDSCLRVELRVPDVPGCIVFRLSGELQDDLLILVMVEV